MNYFYSGVIGFAIGMATMAALDDYMYKHQERIVYVPAQLQDMNVYTCYSDSFGQVVQQNFKCDMQ